MATKEPPTGEALIPLDTGTSLVLMQNPPAAVLAEAHLAAKALSDVLASKPKKVMMNDQQYLEFEDWQTLGRFYGITAKEEGDAEFVDVAGVQGFKAHAVAIDRDGRELSRATAYCLNDEEKWSSRPKYAWAYVLRDGSGHSIEDPGPDLITWVDNPDKPGRKRPLKERIPAGEERVPLFQLSSMAQTRACAKALRNVLSWVVVLAGYRPTPAEEIDGVPGAETVDAEVVTPPSSSAQPSQPPQQTQRRAPAPARQTAPPAQQQRAGGKPSKCPRCGKTGAIIENRMDGHGYVCWTKREGCGYKFDAGDEAIHEQAAAEREQSGEVFEERR